MSELVPVGRVGKRHGLDGSFVVEEASEEPERFAEGAELRVGGEAAVVVASKRAGGRPVIRLDRPVERGAELAVPRDSLPPVGEDEWYAVDLVGLQAVEVGGRVLGRVTAVDPGVANDVLVLENGTLLPFVEACIGDVDLTAGTIVVAAGFADPD